MAAISGALFENNASIVESNQFTDTASDTFFMRVVFRCVTPDISPIEDRLAALADRFSMELRLHDLSQRPKIVVAVSRQGHCLIDLINRWRAGIIRAEIAAVVSNHEELREFVAWNGLPYHVLPTSSASGDIQQEQLFHLVDDINPDLLVLARYMQILNSRMCERMAGRCINIHHSFLPSFPGARPYHRAHERGVKLIGATAHYVSEDLDDGPIIEQAVTRVDHRCNPSDLVALGRDIESSVLSRAVKWHLERRILINDNRTVVFS